MPTSLCRATLFTPHGTIEPGTVVISDTGDISYAGPSDTAPHASGLRLDLRGRIVAPGFIDIHTHGGKGINFYADDVDPEAIAEKLRSYALWAAGNGVTGFLCSIAAPDADRLRALIECYVEAFEAGVPGAEPLGLHLEGPFLSREEKGAFDPDWLREAALEEAKAAIGVGRGWVRQMTLAPELPGADAVAGYLRGQGVVASVGHTNAGYDTIRRALKGNFTHVTHAFNAQRGFHHREPGAIGAILTSDHVTAELIADTVHVHPGAMKLLVRGVSVGRVVLVTDANAAAGLPDGTYEIGGRRRIVENGRSVLEDGTIAGSTATMDTCVRNANQIVGVPLPEAVRMASLNPARAIGMAGRLGSLQEGKLANLIVTDRDLTIYLTLVRGEIVYRNL
ncbi:MAG: N-acetylglucosamine-6-phosphate deacetylase [Anaerolineae bacterium]|jgi:N-acetylglucosamine-6-phosphate deacetylase